MYRMQEMYRKGEAGEEEKKKERKKKVDGWKNINEKC